MQGAWRDATESKVYTAGFVIGRPRNKDLEKRAKYVVRTIEKHVPNERNVAVFDFKPELIKKGFLVKQYSLGTGIID